MIPGVDNEHQVFFGEVSLWKLNTNSDNCSLVETKRPQVSLSRHQLTISYPSLATRDTHFGNPVMISNGGAKLPGTLCYTDSAQSEDKLPGIGICAAFARLQCPRYMIDAVLLKYTSIRVARWTIACGILLQI
jgi:hypothetical protein